MRNRKWRYRLLGLMISVMFLGNIAAAAVPQPQPEAIKTFFDDAVINAWEQSFKDDLSANYVSRVLDKTASHSGSASYRLKLSSATTRGTMLWMNWVDNASFDMSGYDFNSTYLELYYQPLMLRNRVEVGFLCGDNPYASLRVDISRYADITQKDVDQGNWIKIRIPLSAFLDASQAVFADNGSGRVEFNWTQCKGFTIAGSDENIPEQTNFCRIDDVILGGNVSAPQNLKGTASATAAALTWEAPGGKVPDSYELYRDGVQIASVTGTSYTDTGLAGETDYTYQVVAMRGKGVSLPAETTVRTKGYFEEIPEHGIYFSKMRFTDGRNALSTLTNGTVVIEETLTSADENRTVQVAAAVYRGEEMKQIALTDPKAIAAGQSVSDRLTLSVSDAAQERIEVFAIAAETDDLRLCSKVCTLSQDGFALSETEDTMETPKNMEIKYLPDERKIVLYADKTQKSGRLGALVVPQGTETNALREDSVTYLRYLPVTADTPCTGSLSLPVSLPEGSYEIWFGLGYGKDAVKKSIYVAGKDQIGDILIALSGEDVTVSAAKEMLENPALSLDLTDYRQIAAGSLEKAVDRFLAGRDGQLTTVAKVQTVLDQAVGAVLLQSETDPKKMERWVTKYGVLSGLSAEAQAAFCAADAAQKTRICDRLTSSKLVYEGQSDPKQDWLVKYETAVMLAKLSNPELSWKALQTLLVSDYQLVDNSRIAEKGLSESAVYKAMLEKSFYSAAEVRDAYTRALSTAAGNSGGTGGSTGGGGGGRGGSSTSGGSSFKTPSQTETPAGNVQQPENPLFTDLSETEWARESVERLAEEGVVSKDVKYRPNDAVLREEFVKLLIEAFDLSDADAVCSFNDVARDSWFYPYVASAVQQRIVTGISETAFGAGTQLSRQDAAVMLCRMLKTEGDMAEGRFSDDAEIADYAKEAVYTMKGMEILNGRENNQFVPNGILTRAEAAVMIDKTMRSAASISVK